MCPDQAIYDGALGGLGINISKSAGSWRRLPGRASGRGARAACVAAREQLTDLPLEPAEAPRETLVAPLEPRDPPAGDRACRPGGTCRPGGSCRVALIRAA